jgi:hypothetical protein
MRAGGGKTIDADNSERHMDQAEVTRVQSYLREKFGTERLRLGKPKQDGSVEVSLGQEFIGVIYRDVDEDDGEVSYAFHMAILEMDLPKAR